MDGGVKFYWKVQQTDIWLSHYKSQIKPKFFHSAVKILCSLLPFM